MELFERYESGYSGWVKHLEAPLSPGAPYVAIIELDTGKEYRYEVWDQELADTIAVGRRVEKTPGSWEPKVISNTGINPVKPDIQRVSPK